MQGYTSFGLKVRTVMLQNNRSLSSLAEELGISVSYLSEILKGTRKGNKQKAQIARILGLDTGDKPVKV